MLNGKPYATSSANSGIASFLVLSNHSVHEGSVATSLRNTLPGACLLTGPFGHQQPHTKVSRGAAHGSHHSTVRRCGVSWPALLRAPCFADISLNALKMDMLLCMRHEAHRIGAHNAQSRNPDRARCARQGGDITHVCISCRYPVTRKHAEQSPVSSGDAMFVPGCVL